MSTAFASFAVNHSSDAGFRIWGKGVSDVLQAAGAIKTTDTGQIDWATVLYPGSGIGGYEMYKMSDSSGDLYLRIEYGGYSQATYPSLRFRMSSGTTDGAGNFTSTFLTRDLGVLNMGACNSATPRTTYACVTGTTVALQIGDCGFFSVERRRDRVTGALTTGHDFVAIQRVAYASSAAWTGRSIATPGFWVQSFRGVPYVTFNTHREACFVPFSITTSGTPDKNIYRWHSGFPAAHILIAGVSYIGTEITPDTIFTCAPIGGITKTYRATGHPHAANSGDPNYMAAMIWE